MQETYQDMENEALNFKEYKGIFYALKKSYVGKYGVIPETWALTDTLGGPTVDFDTSIYRMDQALSEFIRLKSEGLKITK